MRRKPLTQLGIASALALLVCANQGVGQTLTHRYSFNDTAGSLSFVDSVGGASWNGSLVGAANLDGTSLQLDGFGSFATVPGGMISGATQVTLEFWASFSPLNPIWTRVFSFGDQDGVGNKVTGLDYCHYAGGNWQNLGLTTGAGNVWANNPGGLNGVDNVHVTVVVDPGNNQLYYYNGTKVTSNPGVNGGTTPPLSGLNDTLGLLGKSLIDADATLAGAIDEFRVYTGVLSAARVAINHAAGPNNYVSDPGAIQAVHLASPDNPLVVNQNSQQTFSGDFANVSGVDLVLYGGATFTSGNKAILTV
ncbi:MAG TPA: LamG-like jellyroll fold domain-containing protein, partial [Clostridia bacterium]|nr:LamG-like jellyroll fold domain-containing protein [Clostridia bacterium]